MNEIIAYGLLFATLAIFGWIGYQAGVKNDLNEDEYLSARGSQDWLRIGLSLFASGMGIWILFGPSEVGYYGGFWDVVGYAVSAATPFLLLAYVGPMIRERLPSGVTLADYVRIRLGRPMQVYVGLISVLYMFTFLFAEFTAIGKAMETLSEIEPLIAMGMVGIVTAAYISQGGLPASLATDRVQAWTIMFLVVALLLALFGGDINGLIADAKASNPEDSWSIGSMSYMDSFESGLALVVAITAAEMFSQGNWQRAWASESDEALTKGAWLAAGLVLPLVFIMGVLGTVVAGQGAVDDPSAAFFYLIEDAGTLFVAAFIVLAVALVCSSVDTLQNAIVASISGDLSDNTMSLQNARFLTIGLIPIAIYLATGPTIGGFTFNALGVFEIFLFADLLAAATVMPVLLTLWGEVSTKGALLGAVCGLLSVVAYGTFTGDLGTGIEYVFSPTNEFGLANLNVFLSAVIGSTIVTIGGSKVLPDASA
jgi:SSS family solute:Na+ symporter|tara:strand:+ start:257 stop:1702 length:1446 start_codon:yes stop_codon:yes gene_type:complete